MKIMPYTPEELERVLAYEAIGPPKGGVCDWCGGSYTGRASGPHICGRCWGNRAQMRLAMAEVAVDERDADYVPDAALPEDPHDNTRRGQSE